MSINRVSCFTLVLFMLGSCGDAPQKQAATQSQAASACFAKARALFPSISDGGYELIVEPRIRTSADGNFVFEQDGLGNPNPSKPLLVCEGNLRNRVIESITLDRDLRRAPAGQSWSF